MTDRNGGPASYKARKTPTKIYPSMPATLPASIEVLYHSIDEEILSRNRQEFGDSLVTSQILYKPAILCSARINFQGNRWRLHFEKDILKIVAFPAKHQSCDWDANLSPGLKHYAFRTDPLPDSYYDYDSSFDFSRERRDELQDEFIKHLVSTVVLSIEYNPHLKLERKLDESEESFLARCMESARAEFAKESHNLEETLYRLNDRLKQRLEKEQRSMEDETQQEPEKHDSAVRIQELKHEMAKLNQSRETKRNELEGTVSAIAKEREKDVLRLNRSNVSVLRFALIWLPYTEYVIQEQDSRRLQLVPSF